MQLLTLPNLNQIRDDYPGLHDDLQKLVAFVNQHVSLVGGYAKLTFAGSLQVTGSGGVIDVKITDNVPRAGEEYFIEYDVSPSFTTAHVVALGPGRNRRFGGLPGMTTYWRSYKSTKLGGASNIITFGSPPVGVNPGGAAGPAPAPGSGSGTSGGSGGGFGGNCVLKSTRIVPLDAAFEGKAKVRKSSPAKIATVELPNSEWIILTLDNGMSLIATPDHPVITESGKLPLHALSIGNLVITTGGLSGVTKLERTEFEGIKIKVSMKTGHLFWANGILSHNLKPIS